MKKILYKLFPILPRLNYKRGVWQHALEVKRNVNMFTTYFKDKADLKVNIGCGSCGKDGWVNMDYSNYENVNCIYDCRTYMPFADKSVKLIFTEHFFEHIDYFTEAPIFLSECYRMLQKGGVLRIIIPDAEKFLKAYVADGWDMMIKTRPLSEDLYDELMAVTYETKMQVVNEVFRQSGQHKFAWDFETLKLVLNKAGFKNIQKQDYLKSNNPEVLLDQSFRQYESLYVEAIKD